MSEPQFTPGPWEVRPSVECDCDWEVYKPSPDSISGTGDGEPWFIALVHDGAEGADAEANAHLIAAAPDLFEACEGVLARFESGENLSSLEAEWLRAALVKARGEQ